MTKLLRRFTLLGALFTLVPHVPTSAEELSHYNGEQLYFRYCASCHGEQAEGDGPVGSFFKIAPPDLTRLALRNGGQYPAENVRKVVDGRDVRGAHGSRQMPVWGMEFYYADSGNPDKQTQVEVLIDRLVEYLRTIQKK